MKRLILGALLLLSGVASALGAEENICLFPVDFQSGRYGLNEENYVPVQFYMLADGLKLADEKAQLVITLPEYIEVAAAAPLHPSIAKPLKITRDKERVVIALPGNYLYRFIKPTKGWGNEINIYFRALGGSAGKRADVKFAIETAGKTRMSSDVRFTIYPKLPQNARKMKRFSIGPWYLHSAQMPFPEIVDSNIAFWKSLCERPNSQVSNALLNTPAENIKKVIDNFDTHYLMYSVLDIPVVMGTSYGFFDQNHKVSRPGVPLMVDNQGNKNPRAMCPLYILQDPEKIFWDKYIVEGMQQVFDKLPSLKAWSIDYESMPMSACCENCRAEFARQQKLAKVPTVAEISPGKPLHLAWRYFRANTRTQIIARLSQTMKKHFPDKAFRMCTVHLRPRETWIDNWSALDVKAMDRYVDSFQPMLYTVGTEYFDGLKFNMEQLKKPQLPLIDPAETDYNYFKRYTPDTVRQDILATAAFGCTEMAFYPFDYLDAAYLTMLSDICAAIAEAEDAYARPPMNDKMKVVIKNTTSVEIADGAKVHKIAIPDLQPDYRGFLHNDGRNRFATLFNYSAKFPMFVEISIPDYKGDANVSDLVTQVRLTGLSATDIQKGFLVQIPPNGCALLKIGDSHPMERTQTQAQLQAELTKAIADVSQNSDVYKPKTKGALGIQWIIRNGVPVMQLRNCAATIDFNPAAGGVITGWFVASYGELIAKSPGLKLGELKLYQANTTIPKAIPFNVTDYGFDKSTPYATMHYTVPADHDAGGSGNPLEGLMIERTVRLTHWYSDFELTHKFTNTSQKPMKFGFRLQNMPIYRWKPGKEQEVVLADGRKPGPGTFVYAKPGTEIEWSEFVNPKPLEDLTVTFDRAGTFFKLEAPDFAGLYLWGDHMLQTIEPLSPMIELAPGASRTFTMKCARIRK